MTPEYETSTNQATLRGYLQPRSILAGSISSRVQLVGRIVIPQVKTESVPETPEIEYIDTYVLVLKDGTQVRVEIVEPDS